LKPALKASLIIFITQFILSIGLCQTPSKGFLIKLDNIIQTSDLKLKSVSFVHNVALSTTTTPNISYETPQNYVLNQAITPLAPANAGGAVPATIYAQLSTLSNSFYTATGVATDAAGNLYAEDWGQNQINMISPTGVMTLFAGSPVGAAGTTNGQGTAATFFEPDALIIDNIGNLYVSDQNNNLIRKITPSGLVSTFAGNGSTGAVNGPGTTASFNIPRGLAIDNAGNVYVADQGNNLIREITPTGVVSTFAGNGAAGFTNAASLTSTFNTPTAVAVDAGGNFYVSDSGNGVIRKITAAGVVSTFATGLNYPRELRVDGTGNVYVVEQSGYCLDRISPNGVVTKIVTGLSGSIGLALDGKGNLYLGDGNSVRKVIISGYTIDKTLPAGLSFDPATGIISGTPTVLSSATDYTVTAYNGGGSSTTVVNIAVGLTKVLKQSIITMPLQIPNSLDASNDYNPDATSNNTETPITYTSSNTAVATITPDGLVHVIAPGVSIITANQAGDDNYTAATPVQQTLTVTEYLYVALPAIPIKTICDIDFSANAATSEPKIPMTYSSSNVNVATISDQGLIHITGAGVTTITVSQNASPPLYVSATPQSQTLTVTLPVTPSISIGAQYTAPCIDSTVTFTATINNGGTNPFYQWKLNGNDAGANANTFTSNGFANGDIVTCTCTNTDNSCVGGFPVSSNSVAVSLLQPTTPKVSIVASVNSVYPGVPIMLTASVSNASGTIGYQWQVNGTNAGTGNATFTSTDFSDADIVTCTITTTAACSTPATSNTVKINIVTKLNIPNTFTPNGDGINDTWDISGIADYPNCLVNIYNRYGALVFKSKGYYRPWDGTVNGAVVPVSTYYYVIELGFENKKIGGSVTVIR